MGTMENSKQKKVLKCHLELNFNNFQERKNGNCFDILTIEIDIIGFDVKIISKLVLLSSYTSFYFIFI